MPDEKKKIHFTLLGAKRLDEDFVESTPPSPFSLYDAREQINEIDGIPSCFSFLKEGNVVQSEDEKSISVVDCLTENRLLALVINFRALQSLAESAGEIILRNKDGRSTGEKSQKVVDATVNILKLVSKIGGALDNVFLGGEGEQATAVIKEAAGVMSCAPSLGIAFAAIVPVLTAICQINEVDKNTIDLFDRLETLLAYLNDVVVYVVVVKGGSNPEGDKTFCMLMTLIDQSFAKIMEIHKERHRAGLGGRVMRLRRSNGHLKNLTDLDDKITKILIERTALNSMKYLPGITLDVEKVDRQLLSLTKTLDDYVKKGETTEEEIRAFEDQMGTLGDLVEKNIGLGTNILSIATNIRSMLEKIYTDPNYPNRNERITTDDQISEQLRPQLDRSIQEGVQIDSVLRSAIFLNMMFLTLAYKFQIEDDERYSFCRGMTGKKLSVYLKQEREIPQLHFLPRQATLFTESCNFVESLGDDVILYDIDRSKDCTFGIFINKAARRITIVFRPMITTTSELKIRTLGLPEEIDLSRFSYLKKDTNIGQVRLHRGYYNLACCKYDQIKGMLYKLNDDDPAYKDFSLYVSGHSFGAAIANIVSFLMVMDGYNNNKTLTLTTFGSPRVGNIGWREMNRILGEERRLLHLRVSSDMDIIPSLPPKCMGFYHTGMNLNFKSHSDFVVSRSDLNRIIPKSLLLKHHVLAAYWEHIEVVGYRLELKKIADIYDDIRQTREDTLGDRVEKNFCSLVGLFVYNAIILFQRALSLVTSVVGVMIVIAGISTQPVMSLFFGSIPSTAAWIISFGVFYYAYAIQNVVSGGFLTGFIVLCIICGIIGTPLYLIQSHFKKEKQPKVKMMEPSKAPKTKEGLADKIQKTILRIPFRLILFVLAVLETVFKTVFLSEGRAKMKESWFWDHLYEKEEKFYDYEEVYGGEVQNDYPDELWIYVNGILTELEDAKSGCKRMYEMFGRPVKLLHNPTDGPILDLLECMMGKTGLLRHGCWGPRKLLKSKLEEEMKKDYKKIVLVAHSQGTIITGNVIADFSDMIEDVDGKNVKERVALKKNMSKFEVYIVAGCAHYMTGKYVSHLECLSNRGDFVANLGHLFPKILRPVWRNTWNSGIVYEFCKDHIENSNWGHMLFDHYLDQFENGLFPYSKLSTDYLIPHISMSGEVEQGGPKPSPRGYSRQRARDSANPQQGGQGGPAGDDPDDDAGFTPARNTPLNNRIRFFLGYNCQSTVWNRTDTAVKVIVTDAKIKKTKTTKRHGKVFLKGKVGNSDSGAEAGAEAGVAVETNAEDRLLLAVTTIRSMDHHTFNLNGTHYFLTFYTDSAGAEFGKRVHQVNDLVRGNKDYRIKQTDLDHSVDLSTICNTLGLAIFGPDWISTPPPPTDSDSITDTATESAPENQNQNQSNYSIPSILATPVTPLPATVRFITAVLVALFFVFLLASCVIRTWT